MRMAEEMRVAAQRELHEARLQGRSSPQVNGLRSFDPDDANVHSIIEGLEQAGIGACTGLSQPCLVTPTALQYALEPATCSCEAKQLM